MDEKCALSSADKRGRRQHYTIRTNRHDTGSNSKNERIRRMKVLRTCIIRPVKSAAYRARRPIYLPQKGMTPKSSLPRLRVESVAGIQGNPTTAKAQFPLIIRTCKWLCCIGTIRVFSSAYSQFKICFPQGDIRCNHVALALCRPVLCLSRLCSLLHYIKFVMLHFIVRHLPVAVGLRGYHV